MELKRFAWYAIPAFITGFSVGSLMTTSLANYVRISRYQKNSEQVLAQVVNQCAEYNSENHGVPYELRPPKTVRSPGGVFIVYPDDYCPMTIGKLEEEIKMYKKDKFNPFRILD